MNKRNKRYAPQHRADTNEREGSITQLLKYCTCGILLSLSVAVVVISISAVYALTRTDPESFLLPLAGILHYPCAMLGAFIAYRLYRQSPLLCTAVYGTLAIILSLIMYAILPGSDKSSMSTLSFLVQRILLLACCGMGTLLSKKSIDAQKHPRHRRHPR